MKRAVVFPYDYSNYSLLQYPNQECLQITQVVSPPAWGYTLKDAGYILGMNTGLLVSSSFEQALDLVDACIFVPSKLPFPDEELLQLILQAISAHKDIVILKSLPKEHAEIIKALAKTFDVRVADEWDYSEPVVLNTNYQLVNPPAPIIQIVGMADNTNKHETMLALKQQFESEGYSTLCMGGRECDSFLGLVSYPSFMKDNNVTVGDKILQYNYVVNMLYRKHAPDVILVEVPGGVFPVSDQYNEDYAFHNFLICNAVEADSTVLCLQFENYNEAYLSWLVNTLQNKHSLDVNAFVLSNHLVNWTAVTADRDASYVTVRSEDIDKRVVSYRELGYPVFNSLDVKDVAALADALLTGLTTEHAVQQV